MTLMWECDTCGYMPSDPDNPEWEPTTLCPFDQGTFLRSHEPPRNKPGELEQDPAASDDES